MSDATEEFLEKMRANGAEARKIAERLKAAFEAVKAASLGIKLPSDSVSIPHTEAERRTNAEIVDGMKGEPASNPNHQAKS